MFEATPCYLRLIATRARNTHMNRWPRYSTIIKCEGCFIVTVECEEDLLEGDQIVWPWVSVRDMFCFS